MVDYHQPVLLHESVDGLNIKPDGVYVDATFGGGGHSTQILERLENGKLIAFDQDEDALSNVPGDERILFVRHNFRFLKNFLAYYKIESIDGLIADLGVSSHHFDSADRGFSFRFEGEIDMRMNKQSAFSAKELLNTYSEDKLQKIFRLYGEIQNAGKLSRSIANFRESTPIVSTRELLTAIQDCMPRKRENQYLAKVFQAVRLEVNDEINHLQEMLKQSAQCLCKGGRLVVISYHSLEDRLVKNFIRYGRFDNKVEKDLYGNFEKPFEAINNKVIVPSDEEIAANNRARSAKLRIAERI